MSSLVYLFLAILAAASAAPENRIEGGEPTTIYEFPYIVAFTYTYPNAGITVQRCVGSLISSWHILGSAYCYNGAVLENMLIRAGSTESLTGGSTALVDRFVAHPDYAAQPRTSDLAITFAATPFGITDTVQALYLPPTDLYIADDYALKVVGWGFDAEGNQSETLLSVYLNKQNLEECQSIYEDDEDVTISDSVICASAPGKGTCRGDSGAPMVVNNVIVGHSSFSKDCANATYPDVFTRVNRYTDWILEVSVAGTSRSDKGYMDVPVPVRL